MTMTDLDELDAAIRERMAQLDRIESKLDSFVALVERLQPLIEYAEQRIGKRRSFVKGSTRGN